jgi:hypothetical protein
MVMSQKYPRQTMNIFFLDVVLALSALYHGNKHVVKMPLESVQLLYTAKWMLEPDGEWQASAPWNKAKTSRGYRKTHYNHPLAVWVRESLANYLYCADYALALCAEYSKRFKNKTLHVEQHAQWLKQNPPANLPDIGLTPIPLCVGDKTPVREADLATVVERYRQYYRDTKRNIAKYPYSTVPEWLNDSMSLLQI